MNLNMVKGTHEKKKWVKFHTFLEGFPDSSIHLNRNDVIRLQISSDYLGLGKCLNFNC